VFSDVDLSNATSIQYFTAGNASLGTFFVPGTVGSETFSFLGVSFDAGEQVGRVRITNGNIALGAGITDQNGNSRDGVVMDDFLYGEPRAIPEPASIILVTTGVLSVTVGRGLRRRMRAH
jgi:hypothetical protein